MCSERGHSTLPLVARGNSLFWRRERFQFRKLHIVARSAFFSQKHGHIYSFRPAHTCPKGPRDTCSQPRDCISMSLAGIASASFPCSTRTTDPSCGKEPQTAALRQVHQPRCSPRRMYTRAARARKVGESCEKSSESTEFLVGRFVAAKARWDSNYLRRRKIHHKSNLVRTQ